MPSPPRTRTPVASTIDGLGALELVGAFVSGTAAFGLMTARVLRDGRDLQGVPAGTWAIGFGIGAAVTLALVIARWWGWRRRGGRRLIRLTQRAVLTGELPTDLGLRIRILRELEGRDAALDRSTAPIVLGVVWTLIVALQITLNRGPLDVVAWILVWGIFAASSIAGILERRRRPKIRMLIEHLREQPMALSPSNDAFAPR